MGAKPVLKSGAPAVSDLKATLTDKVISRLPPGAHLERRMA